MRILHKETSQVLAEQARLADTFLERLKGLMFIDEMKGFDGLLIKDTNSVHNCFVRFPLDLVFLDGDLKIVKIVRGFKPWRFTRIYFRARHVLELPAGSVGKDVKEGQYLEAQGV